MDIVNCTPEQWYEKEDDWVKAVQNESVWNKIPLLNVNELHNFKDAQLVKFRGMIQDMHGPEFYMEKYEVLNEDSRESFIKIGKYIDITDCKPNETINFEGPHTVRGERQSMVAISIPGINQWVKKVEEEKFKISTEEASSGQCPQAKRPVEEMDVDQTEPQTTEENVANKRQCTNMTKMETEKTSISTEHLLNFPIPDSSGKVCHLKIYKNSELLKLNSVCEFVGFLSVHPGLAAQEPDENMDEIEFQVHNPPPSLIPRIHCTAFKPLTHNNPLLDEGSMTPEKMQFIKKELLILFTQLLLGDELAAEYLIYHLISEVYLRKDFMAIGKLSLNISNVPQIESHDYVQEFYKFMELLIPKSHYIPMTLDNMNSFTFVPKSISETLCEKVWKCKVERSEAFNLILSHIKSLTLQIKYNILFSNVLFHVRTLQYSIKENGNTSCLASIMKLNCTVFPQDCFCILDYESDVEMPPTPPEVIHPACFKELRKDYASNRLTSSILQLSSNTHLVLDETKLSAGKLNEGGVNGVRAIANAIKNQKTLYDFTYYQIEFECDIPFLILSEGKSMLPSDILVPLDPDEMHLNTFNEILEAARHFLNPQLLNEMRIYLTLARLTKYEITDSIQELVQNEFVKMRQKAAVSGDDLHNLLVLARLVCISLGKNVLDEECWKKACELEQARKERLKASSS